MVGSLQCLALKMHVWLALWMWTRLLYIWRLTIWADNVDDHADQHDPFDRVFQLSFFFIPKSILKMNRFPCFGPRKSNWITLDKPDLCHYTFGHLITAFELFSGGFSNIVFTESRGFRRKFIEFSHFGSLFCTWFLPHMVQSPFVSSMHLFAATSTHANRWFFECIHSFIHSTITMWFDSNKVHPFLEYQADKMPIPVDSIPREMV